jgi:hypothetical protein
MPPRAFHELLSEARASLPRRNPRRWLDSVANPPRSLEAKAMD